MNILGDYFPVRLALNNRVRLTSDIALPILTMKQMPF